MSVNLDIESLSNENINLKQEHNKSSQLIAELTQKLKESEIEKEKLKIKLDDSVKANKKLKDDLDHLVKPDNASKVDKKVQQIYYERQLSKHRDELKELDDEYTNKIFNLKKRNYFLNEEIANLKLERTKATNNLIQKSRCVTRLTKERDELKIELNKLKEAEQQQQQSKNKHHVSVSDDDLFKLKSIKILEDLYEKLKQDYEMKVKEINDLNEKCTNLTQTNQNLDMCISKLNKEIEEIRLNNTISDQLTEMSSRLNDKEAVNVLLQNEKKILSSKCDAMKLQIKLLETEVNNLKQNNTGKETNNTAMCNNKPPTKLTFTINRIEVNKFFLS